jgi:2-oxoglutarate dehydrogenase E2 component (dihydrolipoamide succinyltransferase)
MDIKVPEVGESIFEAEIGKWHKQDGDRVSKDDLLCELETDKISLELNAAADGVLRIQAQAGATVKVGAVIGVIEEGAGASSAEVATAEKAKQTSSPEKAPRKAPGKGTPAPAAEPAPAKKELEPAPEEPTPERRPAPAAESTPAPPKREDDARTTRERMSPLRRKIAERLLAARQQTAMLTTFNEADLSRVLSLRQKHGTDFEQKHGVTLGFMSFFVKAAVEALRESPAVNARIDGEDIVYQKFYDIGIAIGGEKGLVVPVLRDADQLPFARIEQGIRDFVDRIKDNKLNLADLEGGTFTISNGGVYGSLLSTPILNPPQSAVLGMHAIQQRPVVRGDQIVARPMMYLALSYDHRIIDGRQAVTFLKRIKDLVEEPEEMLLEL